MNRRKPSLWALLTRLTRCGYVQYRSVVKDRIGDVSIKLQFGSDEAWTRALRHVSVACLSFGRLSRQLGSTIGCRAAPSLPLDAYDRDTHYRANSSAQVLLDLKILLSRASL